MNSHHTGTFQHHPRQVVHHVPHHHHAESSSMSPQQMVSPHQSHGTDLIGKPIHFMDGQFAGQTIRAELDEVQKADLGRKYARVDRRPLDPPPAVLLRLYQVYNAGTDRETEKEVRNYDEIQNLGLVCTVDLFPVPGPDSGRKESKDAQRKPHSAPPSQTSYTPTAFPPDPKLQAFTFVPSHMYSSSQHSNLPISPVPPLHVPPHPIPGFLPSNHSASDVVYHLDDFAIKEGSKLTAALVGATFVQPASVDYQGKKSLMFVFADLAVKIEGTFILRYRIFDIFSKPYGHGDLAIQAECYGGPFRVYSTKEFPGLQASTELTKQLARWGVRLNIRETERKRRKKGEARSSSPPYTSKGKARHLPNGTYGSDDD